MRESASIVNHGGEAARNIRLLGYNDLQARSAYHPIIHRRDGRWILYVGHHAGSAMNPMTGEIEPNGTSIIDVTDPKNPQFLNHVPPSRAAWIESDDPELVTGTQHVQVCDGAVLPEGRDGRIYLLRNLGLIAHEVLDVTDPQNPLFVTEVVRVGTAAVEEFSRRTHKILWECDTGIAYLVSSVDGWKQPQSLQVFDLSNPERPRHIRNFGLPGTQPGGAGRVAGRFGVHEVTVYGDRIYVAYSPFDNGVLQILDREKFLSGDPSSPNPLAPTPENLRYPQISRVDMPTYWGVHSVKPILDVEIPDYRRDEKGAVRDFLFVVSEGIHHECSGVRHLTFFFDITDERHPIPVSTYQVPAMPESEDDINFCERGVFGPHAPHASFTTPFHKKLLMVAYFSGGVRAVDMRDPFHPVEVGFFIPKAVEETLMTSPYDPELASPYVHTNNVEVDERGFVYIVDRAKTGMHVLELTGEASKIIATHGR